MKPQVGQPTNQLTLIIRTHAYVHEYATPVEMKEQAIGCSTYSYCSEKIACLAHKCHLSDQH